MGKRELFAFLDWLTSGGDIQYAALNPTTPDQKPDLYRNNKRVTVEDMGRWVRNWLELVGLPQAPKNVHWLVNQSATLLANEHVYPGELNKRLYDFCRRLENGARNTSINSPSPDPPFTPFSLEQVGDAFIQQNPQYEIESVVARLRVRNPAGTILVCG